MKPYPSLTRRVARQFRRLSLGLLCPLAMANAWAASGPTITGVSGVIPITDAQTAPVFQSANVTAGSTNKLTVFFNFGPASLGTLSPLPAGVSLAGTNYVIGPTNDAGATALLETLVFTPVNNTIPVPNVSNVVFQVYATDANNNSSQIRSDTVQVTSVDDAPTLTASGVVHITDEQLASPFGNVTVTDPDNQGTQLQTITVTLSHTNTGYLLVGSSGFSSNNFTYTLTGVAPSAVAGAINDLIFQPITNALPVGLYDTNVFTITDSDGTYSEINTNVSVVVYSTNNPPTLSGVPSTHIAVQTGHTPSPSPFGTLTLKDVDHNDDPNDPNGQTLLWNITLTGPSPLGQLTFSGNQVGTTYSGSNEPPAANSLLRQLNYLPPVQTITGTNVLQLAITANDQHGGFLSNNIFLDLYSIISPPGLSGTQPGQIVYDNTTIAPFSEVTIQSHNGNPVTVLIQLRATNDIQGQFINLGSFTKNSSVSPSIYYFSGTSESATAAIEALLFQPTPNRINGSSTDLATFGITLIDGSITNPVDYSTTVTIVPVNDPPTIYGISPLVTIQDNQTLNPFSTVLVTDPDENGTQTNACTITLDSSNKGTFSTNSLLSSGFTNTGSGYVFIGSPAAITAAIRQLLFIPTPGLVPVGLTETTTFTIVLNDNHGGILANSGTAVRVASVSGMPVVDLPTPQPISLPSATNVFPFAEVSVSDPTLLQMSIHINNTSQGYFATNSVSSNGFTNVGNGTYFISGYSTNLTPDMQNLAFVPAANLPFGSVINFTINVTNALPNYVSVNHAIVLRTVRTSYIVTKLTDYNPTSNVASNLKLGTLRNAVANAKSGDHITFDIRSGASTVPDYPAIIRLVAPLVLNNDVTLDGPGADRLAISGDGNGNGNSVELFTVNANAVMNRLAFTNGYAAFAGGGFEVTGSLTLSYCWVAGCRADEWGGAVDVNGGGLSVDHCLFSGNSTSSQLGQGGGAISLYSDQTCVISDTTFATNSQNAVSGLGGGAIYAETHDPGTEFYPFIVGCTFRDNFDAGGQGSSLRPNVDNTYIQIQNSILADGQGTNIEMNESGYVISLGGNISDDSTYLNFSAGGSPQDDYVFYPPLDQTNIPAASIFNPLAGNGGPTPTYALFPGSPAVDNAVSNVETASLSVPFGTDQRGYFRTNPPDIGAFELNASQRVIIEEIGFNPAPPNTNDQFIEFFVPRDSAPVNLAGFQVVVDGTLRHTFPNLTPTLQPGQALVVFSLSAVNTSVPVSEQRATSNLALSHDGSIITLLNTSNQIVFQADYVGSFTATDPNDYGFLGTANQSLVLSPQFEGVFLPYERVVAKDGGANTNGLSNPGYDDVGTPLSGANAPPIAFNDSAATDAHTAITNLPVLANDVDPDITDTIEVVGVGLTNNSVVGVTNLIGYSTLGALLTINNSPTTGASVTYDPTASAYLQSLPQGSNVVDTFQYTILDYSNSVPHSRGSSPQQITQNTAKATATVTVAIVGVNTAPTPQNDSISTSPVLTTPANTLLTFTTAANILENDTDINSDDNSNTLAIIAISATNGFVANVTNITTALGATASLYIRFDRNQTYITYNPTNSAVLYALNRGQAVNDTFYYSAQDSHGAVGTAAISILVTGVDDPPTANPDFLATDENTPLTVPATFFLANDTDPDNGAILHIASVSPFSADGASVQIVGTNIVYDPTVSTNLESLGQKESATDTFTYTVSDEWGLTSTTNVTVQVAGVNDAPISQADFYTTNEDSLLTISAVQGVLANDHDLDAHDSIRVIPFTLNTVTNCDTGANGGAPVTMNANGSFTFDPRTYFDWLRQGDVFQDTFNYVVMDHSLSIANDDNFSVISSSTNNVLNVLANDAVLSGVGGAFTIVGITTPNNGGTVSINASNNAIIYTPAPGYVGPETFTYTNSDGLGGGDHATVNINVVGSTLYALPDSFTVAKGTTNVLNVLLNDTLIPATGANISITALGIPSQGGTVSLNGTGPNNAVNYTPNPSVSAPYSETFSYVITSGSLTATGLVSVTVIDRSNALSLAANNDRFTVVAGSGNNPLNVLANDVILPGNVTNLFITGFTTNNLFGSVSINATQNRLLYKPGTGITNQSELFTYYFADGAGGTGSATVLVQVTPGGFFANDDSFLVFENSTNTLPVMINDVELPNLGQTLFISAIGAGTNAPSHGTVTVNGPGTGLIYVPAPNYSGPDDFTYEISDGSPARGQGHVHVTVLNNSTVPSNPDVFNVARESANNALAVLTNDYTLPMASDPLTITGLLTNGVNATISINGTGTNNTLLYTPKHGFIGTDYFSYVLTDNYGNQGTNLVAVTVGSLAPLNDAFNVLSGSSSNYLDVRANDYPSPDTNALRPIYSIGIPDQGGTVSTNAGATAVYYTPAPGFAGVEHFSYELKDDTTNLFGASVTVTVRRAGSDRSTNLVTIAVVGVNDEPTIAGAQSSFHITDKQSVAPFTNVIIGDLDECGNQTNTVTVSLDNAVKGVLTNLGEFVNIAPGVYQIQDAPAVITAALHGLVFVPTQNRIIVPNSEFTYFAIVANDGYGVPVTNNVTQVLVDSVNDAPVIAGVRGGFQINDKQTVQPFTTAVISDVDNSTLQPLTVNVSLDNAVKGVLTNLGGFTSSGNGVYMMQGTGSNITASLQAIYFVPTQNRIKVPTSEVTTLAISVTDGFVPSPVTNNGTTIIVTATNDPSTITGVQGGWAINDKQTVMPFTNVVVADVDDLGLQQLNVTVALDAAAKGVLTNLGGFTNSAPGIYTMRGVGTNVTSSIQNLVFKPTENRIIVPNSELTTLTILVDDGFQYPLVTNAGTTITVTATNDAPTIAGVATNNITDKQTAMPFNTLIFGDVDNLAAVPPSPQVLTVQIRMDNLDKGALQNIGGFTMVSNGVFQMSGTASNLNASVQAMVFVPVPNHIIVPTTAAIHFGLSIYDGFVTNPTTNTAVVNVTAVDDPPVITGTVAGQIVYDRQSISPFVGVFVTDVDNDGQQPLRVTITLDNAIKGVITNLGGFANLGGGVYSMGASNGVATPAAITASLRGLVFAPTTANRVSFGSPETTRFTIRVDDFFLPTVVDSNTTVTAMDALTAQIVAADRAVNAQFGWSVATLRDIAVIGAPFGSTTNPGSAYVFVRSQDGSNNWTQVKKLVAPDGTGSDLFGTSVSISGGIIVVGASASKGGGGGGAYVFYQNQGGANNWGFIKRLAASDDVPNNSFGAAVLVSNTLVVVGAPQALTSSNGSAGAIYLYQKDLNGSDQWGFVKKTSRSGLQASDRFGSALSLSGDTLAVGTPLSTNGFNASSGAVFMFDRNSGGAGNWGQTTRIVSTNTSGSDHFGNSVSISGDNLAVGAPQFSLGSTSFVGSAYVFNRNQGGAGQWGAIKRIVLTNAAASDYLGTAVALDGNSLVVTAPQTGVSNGVAYLYQQNIGGSNQWGQLDRFEPAAVGPLDAFGSAASIFNNTIVIGAYNGLYNGQRSGDVYMFRIFYDNTPEWLIQMANQYLQVGTPFAFSVPAGALVDPDINDVLAYSLGSSPVPSWLNFDPVAGNFSGTPTAAGVYTINLLATDIYGLTSTNQFLVTVSLAGQSNFNILSASVAPAARNVVNFQLSGVPNQAYRLQMATNLISPTWINVYTQAADINGNIQVNVTNPPAPSYYRTVYP